MNFKKALLLIYISLFSAPFIFAQSKRNDKAEPTVAEYMNKNFPLLTPSRWTPGEEFVYIDSALNVTIIVDTLKNNVDNYTNKIFTFRNFTEKTDWLGKSSIFLIFEAEGNVYSFNTRKNLHEISDTLYNPLIPSFISVKELENANKLLKGREMFILGNEWLNDEQKMPTYKFVPVRIDYLTMGNNLNPYRLYFTYKGNQYYVYTNLSNSLYGTSRYLFTNMFSFENPRNKHKDIDDETWEYIVSSRIKRGMTQNEVRLSIGKPTDIRRIPTYSGLKEIWSYGSGQTINFFDARVTD